jgi:hypothetical protein
MQALTWDLFGRLAREEGGLRASAYVPLGPLGDARPGLVRLERILADLEQELRAGGLAEEDAAGWTAAARQLLRGDPDLQAGGAAGIFLAEGSALAVHVPGAGAARIHVGPRHLVTPLVASLQGGGTFFILALSRHGLRLLRCTQTTVERVDAAVLGRGVDEVLAGERHPRNLQVHSVRGQAGGRWIGVFHGHGGEAETAKDRDLRYLRALELHVRHALGTGGAPLVLAGVEPLVPAYRRLSGYPHLMEAFIAGSPGGVPDDVLHERALPLVAPWFAQAAQREAERYALLAGTGLATDDASIIAAKARAGLVDALFLLEGGAAWGRRDAAARYDVHGERAAGDEDLVNDAVIDTYRTGGRLYAHDPFGVAPDAALAAILRA